MASLLKFLGYLLIAAFLFDIIVLNMMMIQLASGVETPHIEFWDSQIKALTP